MINKLDAATEHGVETNDPAVCILNKTSPKTLLAHRGVIQ